MTINHNVKLEKHDNIVTILIGNEKYTNDISKYKYVNSSEQFTVSFELIDYSVEDGMLLGAIPVYVSQDTVGGGLIGYLKLEYVGMGKSIL